jgi:cytidylate kinase
MLPVGIGLRVRIVAPHQACVDAFAKRSGLSIEEARASVKRLEKERKEFIERHFKAEVDDPARHDIVINRAQFSLEQAVEMILAARDIIYGSQEAT